MFISESYICVPDITILFAVAFLSFELALMIESSIISVVCHIIELVMSVLKSVVSFSCAFVELESVRFEL